MTYKCGKIVVILASAYKTSFVKIELRILCWSMTFFLTGAPIGAWK